MEAEVLGAQGLELFEALVELLGGEAVFGVAGGVHHLKALFGGGQLEGAAGIIPAGDGLGDIADGILQKVDVGEIVEIDGGPQLCRQLKFAGGGLVGGEHDLAARKAAAVGHYQLGEGGAVGAAAFLPENLQNGGGGSGLDGKIFLEAGVPGEGLHHLPGVFADALFVVEVEGGGVGFGDFLNLRFGHKRCFHSWQHPFPS